MNVPTFGGFELVVFITIVAALIIGKSHWDARTRKRREVLRAAVSAAENTLQEASMAATIEIVRAVKACAEAYIATTQRKSTTSSIENKHSLQGCSAVIVEAGEDYTMVVKRDLTMTLPCDVVLTRSVKTGEPVMVELSVKAGSFDALHIRHSVGTAPLFKELALMERAIASCATSSLSDVIKDRASSDDYMRYACAVTYFGTVSHTRDAYKRSGDHTVISDLVRIGKTGA